MTCCSFMGVAVWIGCLVVVVVVDIECETVVCPLCRLL